MQHTLMKIPKLPFTLKFNHNGSDIDGLCVNVESDNMLPEAFRFFVQTRRMFGMLPNEQVCLINNRGERCKAKLEHPE